MTVVESQSNSFSDSESFTTMDRNEESHVQNNNQSDGLPEHSLDSISKDENTTFSADNYAVNFDGIEIHQPNTILYLGGEDQNSQGSTNDNDGLNPQFLPQQDSFSGRELGLSEQSLPYLTEILDPRNQSEEHPDSLQSRISELDSETLTIQIVSSDGPLTSEIIRNNNE